MIIIQFDGGLGNQMFMYAFYRKMCKVYNRNRVKAHWQAGSDHYGYELEKVFHIQLPFASPNQVAKNSNFYPTNGKKYWLYSRLFNMRSRVFGDKASFIKQDEYTEYYPEMFELSPLRSYLLTGVWANELYFRDMKEELISSFVFQNIDDRNAELAKKLAETQSVAIHVRNYNDKYAILLGQDFYAKAVEAIKEKIPDAKFYVFSDDHNKAQKILDGITEYQPIDINKETNSYLDMMLMSKCRYNIIANSTFSFWSAYLNQNPDKIVIGPTLPMGKDIKNCFSCEGWLKL